MSYVSYDTKVIERVITRANTELRNSTYKLYT